MEFTGIRRNEAWKHNLESWSDGRHLPAEFPTELPAEILIVVISSQLITWCGRDGSLLLDYSRVIVPRKSVPARKYPPCLEGSPGSVLFSEFGTKRKQMLSGKDLQVSDFCPPSPTRTFPLRDSPCSLRQRKL